MSYSKDKSVSLGNVLGPTKLRIDALANPILGSHTHALYSANLTEQARFDGVVMSYSKDKSVSLGNVLGPTKLRIDALANPILGSHTHALYSANLTEQARFDDVVMSYSKGKETTLKNVLGPTKLRIDALANPILGSHTHALYSANLTQQARFDEVVMSYSKDKTITLKNVLGPTKLRIEALANPILGSHTHALHSANLTEQARFDGVVMSYSKDKSVTLGNVLGPTKLRIEALANPILGSHTHALHSAYIGGFQRYEDVVQISSKSGVEIRLKNVLEPTKTRLERLAANPILNSHTHALHSANKSGQVRGQASQTGFRGQAAITYSNLLSPTVRRLEGLAENPVLKSFTHALHSAPGKGGNIWAKTGRFATFHTQIKDGLPAGAMKTGALHGVSGKMSGAGGSLVSGLAGALKDMIFGKSDWPLARFYFYVMVGGNMMSFQAVEGLESEVGVIEYRDGNAPFFGKEKMPGMISYSRVTMKKGTFANETTSDRLFKEIAVDRKYTTRKTIMIAMLDHNHIPQFVWRYEKCFITKFTPTNLDAESENEVAIEELEFVGRSWHTETLMMAAGAAAGAAMGAIKGTVNIGF
jgi:phage tail-like protein